jgi:hypothetical protein
MEFIISQTDDILVSHAGLALAGALLQRTELRQRLDARAVEGLQRPVMPHGEVLLSMIGLLCLGKSDYAAIEPFRRESFFARSLGLRRLPSEETLRQRMDQLGTAPLAILHEETAALLRANAPALASCHRGRVPLDVDVSPWDNSGTKKEGVACGETRSIGSSSGICAANRQRTGWRKPRRWAHGRSPARASRSTPVTPGATVTAGRSAWSSRWSSGPSPPTASACGCRR